MIRPLTHDQFFLQQKSAPADRSDSQTMIDLEDTLQAHKDVCVGMAANMIGVRKAIICFYDGARLITMLNPKLLRTDGAYETTETCLSYLGAPKTVTRYQRIEVAYETKDFKRQVHVYTGFTAQIIQHEIDHCNGVLV